MSNDLVKRFKDELDKPSFSDYNGLRSPGLTCYLNSVLQVLFMTKDFRDVVKSINDTSIEGHLGKLFNDLERMDATTCGIVTFLDISNVYEQQDAAEYLEKILSRCSRVASKIFQGELIYNATCLACKEENHSRSMFWLLPLPMGELQHVPYNVEDGLKSCFEVQKVNRLYCTSCKKKQDANLKCKIAQAPNVVTLLLKRFTFDSRRRCYVKLQCGAVVPQTLSVERCTYELYAVVNHVGTLTGGHYTAEIKSFETGWWYSFNDDVVKSLKTAPFGGGKTTFRSCSAYILMYKKVKVAPDGGDVEAQSAQADVEAEKRPVEAEPGDVWNGSSARGSGSVPVCYRSVNTLDQRGVTPPLDGNRKHCRRMTNEPKLQTVRSNKQEAGQTVTRGPTRKRENSPKPWRL